MLVATGAGETDARDTVIRQNRTKTTSNAKNDVINEDEIMDDVSNQSESESDDEDDILQATTDNKNISLKIINLKLHIMIEGIANFLHHNWENIKGGIIGKKKDNEMLSKFDKSVSERLVSNSDVFRSRTFVKRIVYILSELSVHVNIDQKEILEKLAEMLIPLITVKGFISGSKEDLINHTFVTIQRL